MLVVPKMTGNIPSKYISNTGHIPQDINLKNSLFWSPQKIDILVGATHFYELMCERQVKPKVNGPIFQETRFGWIVSGSLPMYKRNAEPVNHVACNFTSMHTDMTVEYRLPLFRRLEEFEINATYTIEETVCQKYFDRTVTRDTDGRFIVSLPFRENVLSFCNAYLELGC